MRRAASTAAADGVEGGDCGGVGVGDELLLEDERCHRCLFDQLANSSGTTALMRREEPDIPDLDFHRPGGAAKLLAAKELLANEEEDLRAKFKALERELREVKHTSLWSLLVDLMRATRRSTSPS